MKRIAVLVALATAVGHAQPPQRASGTAEARVTAVLVDIVVRDKRGEPVRDLAQADFQIFEDGVPQTISSFAPIFDGAVAPAPETPAPPASATGRSAVAVGSPSPVSTGPTVTALVFDRLTPEA